MPSPLAESILALAIGRTRAAVLYGDLLELARTRGRFWFIAAYLRTLFSLTWRIVLALFVADIARQSLFDLFHLYLSHQPAAWRTAGGPWLNLTNSAGPLLACILSTLWFMLPFAAVLYGVRDRFVRLTFAIAVGTTLGFWFVPWASALFVAATAALAIGALFSTQWRKPVEILAIAGAIGLLFIAAATGLGNALRHAIPRYGLPANLYYSRILLFQGSLLVVAIACTRLHRRMLEPGSRTAA